MEQKRVTVRHGSGDIVGTLDCLFAGVRMLSGAAGSSGGQQMDKKLAEAF